MLEWSEITTLNSTDNGDISYVYDATGIKQRKIVNDSGNITTTNYANGFIYEADVLQFFSHAEGYIEPVTGGFEYVYQYADHLGNIRLSYNRIMPKQILSHKKDVCFLLKKTNLFFYIFNIKIGETLNNNIIYLH